jgi:hypothetical protein
MSFYKRIQRKMIKAGHTTVIFFTPLENYDKALREFEAHRSMDHDWHDVDDPKKDSKTFKTLKEAKEWAYDNVNDYASYALKVESPVGWLFAADIHI